MAMPSLSLPGAEVDVEFKSASELTGDPMLDFRSTEPPQLSDVNTADYAFASQLLKGLWVNFHDRGGFIGIQERLR